MSLIFKHNGSLALLMLNIFLAMAAFGLVVPIMPTLMKELNINGSIVGLLTAAFAVTQLLFSPFAGRLCDQIGRKKVIVSGLALLAFSEAIFAFSSSVYLLFFSRLLGGTGVALIYPGIMAFTADVTTENERAKGMGWISAAMSTGFIIGPGIGGFLAEYGVRMPFLIATIVISLSALLSLLILPESSEISGIRHTPKNVADQFAPTQSLWSQLASSRKAPYFFALLILLVLGFGLSSFETVISLYLDAKHGFGPKDIAMIMTVGAIAGVFIQIVLLDLLVNKLGEIKVMLLSLFIAGVFIIAMLFAHNYLLVMLVSVLIFAACDLLRPAASTYLSRSAGADQGYIAGLNSSFTSLGTIMGSAAAGFLYDLSLSLPLIVSGLTFVLCCIILLTKKDNTHAID